MDPDSFKRRARPLLQGRGWRKRFAAAIGVDYATVKRWTAENGKVPTYVEALIECLEALEQAGLPLPERFARADASGRDAAPKTEEGGARRRLP